MQLNIGDMSLKCEIENGRSNIGDVSLKCEIEHRRCEFVNVRLKMGDRTSEVWV